MTYLIIAIVSFVALDIYRRLALRTGILDLPNKRSSHNKPTVRGGGVIFPLLAILWYLLNDNQYPFFLGGILLVALISFIDDIRNLSFKVRLLAQFASVALLILDVHTLSSSWMLIIPLLFLTVGWLNTYNFMDGINGITPLYALSAVLPFWVINQYEFFVQDTMILSTSIVIVAFSLYNVRKRALMFAGDVGSISLAFILAFFMINLLATTQHWFFILFFLIYGVDSILTIAERLLKGENIFEAHRSHLYQILSNEFGWKHLQVATLYALLQFFISLGVIAGYVNKWPGITYVIIMMVVIGAYVILKAKLKAKIKTELT